MKKVCLQIWRLLEGKVWVYRNNARYYKVDLILSQDKDFLDAGENLLVFSPAMMLEYLEKR